VYTPKNRFSKGQEQNWNVVKLQSVDDQQLISQSVSQSVS
jgi:hypothetical protein